MRLGDYEPMNKKSTKLIFWVDVAVFCVIALILGTLLIAGLLQRTPPTQEAFSQFHYQADQGIVSSVKIYSRDLTIDVDLKDGTRFKTAFPADFDIKKFLEGKVKTVEVDPQRESSVLIGLEVLPLIILSVLIPAFIVLTVVLIVFMLRQRKLGQDSESEIA